MPANGLNKQGCEYTVKFEQIVIVNDNKGCLNATSGDSVRLRMKRVSSLLARFLVRHFFSFKKSTPIFLVALDFFFLHFFS